MGTASHYRFQKHADKSMSFFVLVSMLLVCWGASGAYAQSERSETFFLGEQDYGTEPLFSPITVLLNSGFDIFRSGAYDKSLLNVQFGVGAANVVRNLASPIQAIRFRRAGDFISHEIFPYRAFNTDPYFVPLLLHVLGGMVYQARGILRARRVALSQDCALLTIGAAQFLNETVENGSYRGSSIIPSLIFCSSIHWGGCSSAVCRRTFLQTDDFISINFWPGQPALDLQGLSLYNSKLRFSGSIRQRVACFILQLHGIEELTGLSYQVVW